MKIPEIENRLEKCPDDCLVSDIRVDQYSDCFSDYNGDRIKKVYGPIIIDCEHRVACEHYRRE